MPDIVNAYCENNDEEEGFASQCRGQYTHMGILIHFKKKK